MDYSADAVLACRSRGLTFAPILCCVCACLCLSLHSQHASCTWLGALTPGAGGRFGTSGAGLTEDRLEHVLAKYLETQEQM
jgi:hypothetical protein